MERDRAIKQALNIREETFPSYLSSKILLNIKNEAKKQNCS
jgi:hypothetical protein